jgi:hypothetical protein
VESSLAGMEARMTAQSLDGAVPSYITFRLASGVMEAIELRLAAPAAGQPYPVECAFGRILEARLSLAALGVARGRGVRFQLSLWQGGLPVDAVPQQGWLEMPTTDPGEMEG